MTYARKIKSPKHLEELWEEYKKTVDKEIRRRWSKTTITSSYDDEEPLTEETIREDDKPNLYTLTGLCGFIGISLKGFSKTYRRDPAYSEIIGIIETECEVDTLTKIVKGDISPSLAGILLSKYGYGVKGEVKTDSGTVNNLLDILKESVEEN